MGLVFEGDSLTAALISPLPERYPSQVAAGIATPLNWYNVAIPATTIVHMIARAAANVDKYAHPEVNSPPHAVILWGGSNDIAGADSAATIYASIKAYCQARKAIGWKVVVLTILPRLGNTGYNTKRLAVNTLLLADFPSTTQHSLIYTGASYADYLVDVGSDQAIGEFGDELNPAYYSDGIHLTAAGMAIVADYVRKAIFLFP